MSGLPERHDHRPRTATPPEPRRPARIASGCGAESVSRAGRPSRSCPIGSRRRRTYSLRCRQQACERIAAGDSVEQAAPHCKDPSRLPDPSTLRRWAQRRLLSVWCWVKAGVDRRALFAGAHHPCLGSRRALPYSADRGKKSVNRQALDELKQQIPLMGYLQAHDWQPGAATQPRPMDGAVPSA